MMMRGVALTATTFAIGLGRAATRRDMDQTDPRTEPGFGGPRHGICAGQRADASRRDACAGISMQKCVPQSLLATRHRVTATRPRVTATRHRVTATRPRVTATRPARTTALIRPAGIHIHHRVTIHAA